MTEVTTDASSGAMLSSSAISSMSAPDRMRYLNDRYFGGSPSSDIEGVSYQPLGSTWRGIGSSWFNANNVAKEDWVRGEQSADNAHARQMAALKAEQDFNSSEAQKSRDYNSSEAEKARQFEKELRDSSYLSMVEQMKKVGINPVLAFQQGGASASSVPSASSSPASSGSSHGSRSSYQAKSRHDPLPDVLKLVAGLVMGFSRLSATTSEVFENFFDADGVLQGSKITTTNKKH